MFFQWLSLDCPWRRSWWSGRTFKKSLYSSQNWRSSGWWVEDVLNKCAVPRKNKHTHSYLSTSNFSCILQRILFMVQFILKWPLTYIKRLLMMLRSRSLIEYLFYKYVVFLWSSSVWKENFFLLCLSLSMVIFLILPNGFVLFCLGRKNCLWRKGKRVKILILSYPVNSGFSLAWLVACT